MSDSRRREIDDAVTRRIAEIASAAGVPHARASLEVLYYLPKDFLDAYVELFNSSLKLDSGGVGGPADEGKAGVSSSYKGKRPMVTGGGKRYKEYWVVLNDSSLDMKNRVDKRLRQVARDIRSGLMERDTADGRVQCRRCGRILGRDWKFCAECGTHRPHGDD